MTQAKHTPGPWLTNTAGSAKRGEPFKITEIYVYAPETQDDTAICADVIDPITQEPSAANATLIAAAPELLEANIQLVEQVKQLLDQIEKVQRGEWKPTSFCTSAARAVAADARETIAKAGGAA